MKAFDEIEAQQLNVIVAISHAGEDAKFREFGATKTDGISVASTQIDINSVTKTVTGVMAAKLVDQGKLSTDETLADVFEDVPVDKRSITLHQLLTHSSGMIDAVGDDAEKIGRDDFLERAFHSELLFEPGSGYSYSNTGYGVVAAAIELRSGKTYEEYLQQHVCVPIGLTSTGYSAVYLEDLSLRTTTGSAIADASWGGDVPYWNLIGNGGLISTVPDMMAFRRAVASGAVISREMLETVHTPHIAEDFTAVSHYGYGVVIEDTDEAGRFYWHSGGNNFYSDEWADYPVAGDLIFTAGTEDDAFTAIHTLERNLYGYDRDDLLRQIVAAGVVGILCLLAVIAAVVRWFVRRRNQRTENTGGL
ncbi:serine hydrolase [bacterium]|nr:serine hydrolase [bacterium]